MKQAITAITVETLGEIGRQFRRNGYRVHAISRSWKDAIDHKQVLNSDVSSSVEAWISDIHAGQLELKKDLVIVLNAKELGVRQMKELLEVAALGEAKVVLHGANKQPLLAGKKWS